MTTVINFIKHILKKDSLSAAAQTAFFFLLAFFPLGMFLGWALSAADAPLGSLEGLFPRDMLELLTETAAPEPLKNPFAFLVSFWAASAGVWALMRGVSHAYTGKRLSSFKARIGAAVFTAGFLAVLTLTVAALALGRLVSLLALGAAITLLLFALYTLTPGTSARPVRALWTAAAGAAAWLAVSWGFELYLRLFANFSALYGGLGVFLGLAIWIYAICIIIIIGAELGGYDRREAG